jgi:hypothetical protein
MRMIDQTTIRTPSSYWHGSSQSIPKPSTEKKGLSVTQFPWTHPTQTPLWVYWVGRRAYRKVEAWPVPLPMFSAALCELLASAMTA